MKSQSYYIKSLCGFDTLHKKAIIVFEGKDPNSLDITNINTYLSNAPSLVSFIEKINTKPLNSKLATIQGF